MNDPDHLSDKNTIQYNRDSEEFENFVRLQFWPIGNNGTAVCPIGYEKIWNDPKNWSGFLKLSRTEQAFRRDNTPQWFQTYERLLKQETDQKQHDYYKIKYKDNYIVRESIDDPGNLSPDDYKKWLEMFKGFAAETYFPIASEGERQSNCWCYTTYKIEHDALKSKYGGDTYILPWLKNGHFGHDEHEYLFWQNRLGSLFFELSIKRGLFVNRMVDFHTRINIFNERFLVDKDVMYKRSDRNIRSITRIFIKNGWDKCIDSICLEINKKFPNAEVISKVTWGGNWKNILDCSDPDLRKHGVLFKNNGFKILQPKIGGETLEWESFYDANKPFGRIQSDGHNTWIIYPHRDNIHSIQIADSIVECIGPDPNMGIAGERLVHIRKQYTDLKLIRGWVLCESEYLDITNKFYDKVSETTKARCNDKKRRKTSHDY